MRVGTFSKGKIAMQKLDQKKGFKKMLLENRVLLLLLLPAVAYVIIFSYIPMSGIVLAFKNFNYRDGIFGSPWNGFDNFRYFLISGKLWPLTRNTILYNAAFIVTGIIFEVSGAVFLNEIIHKRFKKVCQSMMLLPYFLSWVIVSSIMINMFGYEKGVLNNILTLMGLPRVDIYESATRWPIVMILLRAWKNTGYGLIIYLSAITNIDQQMYEAADIDGAGIWRKVWSITLPSLRSTIVIMFLLAMGQLFRGDFGMFYQIVKNNQVLLQTSDIIDTFVYRSLITSPDIGMAAAAGLYQSVMCFFAVMLANFVVKKVEPNYSLF